MGAREMTTPEERARRVRRVIAVGEGLHGDTWTGDLARTLNDALQGTGATELTRTRVAQWMLDGANAKPVPAWVDAALPELARKAREVLQERIARIDALFADEGDEGAPPASGEPEPEEDVPLDPAAAAARRAEMKAIDDAGFDYEGFLAAVVEAGPWLPPPR